jgi:hypothetical protein
VKEFKKMKKIFLAVSLALSATAAQADIVSGPLTLSTSSTVNFVGVNDITGLTSAYTGTLIASEAVEFRVTFLGIEAGDTNFYVSNGSEVIGSAKGEVSVGQVFYFDLVAGAIDFGFGGSGTLGGVSNGSTAIAYNTTGLIDPTTGLPFQFIIGFNDSGSPDGDFDDYVIGVTATVPVPAALPLMASALGMFGIARRRKNKAA